MGSSNQSRFASLLKIEKIFRNKNQNQVEK